ncbi:MAG: LysE family translocator, partial [Chloroflexi bacterium]
MSFDTQLLVFAGVSLLLAVTPGPDMAVVTKNALTHGRRGVVLTTTGIALALSIWVTATAIGLSAVLRASGELLFVLKLVGAAYLAYLGIRSLLESRQRPADLLAGTPPPAPAHAIFRQGFLSALSNPK